MDSFNDLELKANTPTGRGFRALAYTLLNSHGDSYRHWPSERIERLDSLFFGYNSVTIQHNPNELPPELIRYFVLQHFKYSETSDLFFSNKFVKIFNQRDGRLKVEVDRRFLFTHAEQKSFEQFERELNHSIANTSYEEAKNLFIAKEGRWLEEAFWGRHTKKEYLSSILKYIDDINNKFEKLSDTPFSAYVEFLLEQGNDLAKERSQDYIEQLQRLEEHLFYDRSHWPSTVPSLEARNLFEMILTNDLYRTALPNTLDRLAEHIGFDQLNQLWKQRTKFHDYLEIYRRELIDYHNKNSSGLVKTSTDFETLKPYILKQTKKRNLRSQPKALKCSQSIKD